MRVHAVVLGLVAFVANTSAQNSVPQIIPGSVTAEAVEVVRVTPDQAKVYVSAVSRNGDPGTASDDASELAERFSVGIGRMRLGGLKVNTEPVKLTKLYDERVAPRGGFGGGAPLEETQASRQVVVTITDPDPKALAAAVEKVQKEAIREGLTGAATDGLAFTTPYPAEVVRVAYMKREGMDELLTAALVKATKKATARAEAIASGLGKQLGEVVAAEEVSAGDDPSALTATTTLTRGTTALSPSAELVEGELVRTVRVRVIYLVK